MILVPTHRCQTHECSIGFLRITMPVVPTHDKHHAVNKRGVFNFGGCEYNPSVEGDSNQVSIGVAPGHMGQETLLRKTGAQIGKIIEGGADLITVPAKWLNHMQENW